MGREVPTPLEFSILEETLLHLVESPPPPTEHSLVPECGEGRKHTFLLVFRHCWRRRQWHPTPVLLPGKSMDGGAWWAAVHGVAKSQNMTERLSLSLNRETCHVYILGFSEGVSAIP